MAGLDNRWTALADDDGPVVTGLVNAGDSLTHTNPTSGHGVSLGLRVARHRQIGVLQHWAPAPLTTPSS